MILRGESGTFFQGGGGECSCFSSILFSTYTCMYCLVPFACLFLSVCAYLLAYNAFIVAFFIIIEWLRCAGI